MRFTLLLILRRLRSSRLEGWFETPRLARLLTMRFTLLLILRRLRSSRLEG
jgi:hypothetical protein